MSASAFKATYSDWKLVRTRQVVQIVFEVPLADADSAYDVLGGMPNSAESQWFGIAAIKSAEAQPRQEVTKRTAGAKRDWNALQPAAQAGIRCDEPAFCAFLKEVYPKDWRESEAEGEDETAANCVRLICRVHSRAELGTNHKARVIWHQLDEKFQVWMKVPV